MSDQITLPRFIKQRRKTLGYTQRDFADKIGYSYATVRRIESGKGVLAGDLLEHMRAALELTANEQEVFDDLVRAQRGGVKEAHEVQQMRAQRGTPYPGKIPASLTPLIGREQDITTVTQILTRDDARIVTLIGPPGVGKTRLAQEVAKRVQLRYADGVCYVSLALVDNSNLVLQRISEALGVTEKHGWPTDQLLRDFLDQRHLLLILDNCEQVLAAGPDIAALLMACSKLTILATSRTLFAAEGNKPGHARFKIAGERQLSVDPLLLPSATGDLAAISASPAVALFVARVRDVLPKFTLTEQNAQAIHTICRQLAGLPLVIELVAAWAEARSLDMIAEEWSSLLADDATTLSHLPVHQRTLDTAIAWSLRLLPDQRAQSLFAELGIFRGGSTNEAIAAVCGQPTDSAKSLGATIKQLRDHQLIRKRYYGGTPTRGWSMLEPLRAAAQRRLPDLPNAAALAERHSRYYGQLAQMAEDGLKGTNQGVWMNTLEVEYENLRAAIQWSLAHDGSLVALQIMGNISRFWLARGYLNEARHLLRAALEATRPQWRKATVDAPPEERSQALIEAACRAARAAGVFASVQADYADAEQWHQISLTLARTLGDTGAIAHAFNNLGAVAQEQGNYDVAFARYMEGLELRKAQGNQAEIAKSFNNLGLARYHQKRWDDAEKFFEASLAIKRQLPDQDSIAATILNIGEIARARRQYDRAALLFREYLQISRALRVPRGVAGALINLGAIAQAQGDHRRALGHYRAGLEQISTLNEPRVFIEGVEGLVSVVAALGQPEDAARLLGAMQQARHDLGMPVPGAEQERHAMTYRRLQRQLGEKPFQDALHQGRGWSLPIAWERVQQLCADL